MKSSLSSNWSGLPRELATELLSHATPRPLKAGQTLFEIGDEGDGCYRVEKGALKVSLTSPHAEERIIAILAAGSLVCDLSMIDGKPRSATVVALIPSELSFFDRQTFEEFAKKHP